ncbi:unknown [Ruminococcus sp. CAG:624]|nr:unknown [Ruminococcus sp. CAG:624]
MKLPQDFHFLHKYLHTTRRHACHNQDKALMQLRPHEVRQYEIHQANSMHLKSETSKLRPCRNQILLSPTLYALFCTHLNIHNSRNRQIHTIRLHPLENVQEPSLKLRRYYFHETNQSFYENHQEFRTLK